jgi:hypothetical protein
MNPKFTDIGTGKDLLATIKEAEYADNLFIGTDEELMQWSVSQKKVTKNYGHIMAGYILLMV